MRRGYFIAVVIFVAALVIVSGILLVQHLPGLIPESSGREMLTEWIEENTNAELAAGYVAPLFLPGIGIQLRDIDLRLKDEQGAFKEFFSAKAIKVVTDLPELLKNHKVVINEIIVESPQVSLVLEPSGKFNAARWASTMPARDKDGKKPEDDGLLVWMIKDILKQALPTTGTGLTDLVTTGRVEINDAELKMVDRCESKKFLKAPVDLSNIQLLFSGAISDSPGRFTLSFPFPQSEGAKPGPMLDFKGSVKAPSDDEIAVTSFSGRWSDIIIHSLTGGFKFKPEFSFDSNIDATFSFASFYRAATWRPISFSRTIPDMEGSGSGRIKLHVWGPEKSRFFKIHYKGKADLYGMTWNPGRVLAPLENLRTTVYFEDGLLRMPETTIHIAGSDFSGHGKMFEAKRPRFVINARADHIDFDEFFAPRKTPYKKGKPMRRMRTLWGGEAFIEEGVHEKMRIYDARGAWDVTNKRLLTFSELEFNSCGGTYTESGRSWIDFNDPTDYYFRFDGRLRGIDITQFADQVFDTTTFLHGTADADGHITGMFSSGEFVTRSMGGEIFLTVRDGYFEGFNIVGSILDFFGLAVPEDFAGQKFTKMTAFARFDRGVAYTDDLHVETASLTADAKGWIDFHKQHTDLKIKLHFLRPITRVVKELPLIGEITAPAGEAVSTLYVRAHGHWDYLEYSVWNPMDESPPEAPEIEGEIKPGSTVE
jgi:hypothetical protein